MADSNLSRVDSKARFQRNKAAFEEVFGNPFFKPEPLQGHYQGLLARSSIQPTDYTTEGIGTKNPCQPSLADFSCDIEAVIKLVMLNNSGYERFMKTYIYDDDATLFDAKARQQIEQEIGAVLLKRKISPVLGYFRTERKARSTKR